MTREEYAAIPALNFSLAKHLLRGPAWFKAAKDEEREETEAMRIGTLVHAMVLEGKDLRDLYAIKPKGMSFATNDGKLWKSQQTLPIITEDEAEGIPRIAEAIAKHPHAARVLSRCPNREFAITGNMRGVECKSLLDMAGSGGGKWAVLDLKTARDASPRGFAKAIIENHLDLQQAFYTELLAINHGLEAPPFFGWLAIEKSPPYYSALYEPDEQVRASGSAKLEKVLTLYKQCQESGDYSLPYADFTPVSMPDWAVEKPLPQPA